MGDRFGEIKFNIKPTAFKHTGVSPEQEQNWNWTQEKIKNSGSSLNLNLFGYTGGATLAALAAGAEVTHVDGSKSAVSWAKENAELSGLIKNQLDGSLMMRGNLSCEKESAGEYDAIVMDPPRLAGEVKARSGRSRIISCRCFLNVQKFFPINQHFSL